MQFTGTKTYVMDLQAGKAGRAQPHTILADLKPTYILSSLPVLQ